MEVLGRDSAREAYRVAIGDPGGRLVGLVPDGMISATQPLTGGRGHGTAYAWLARHADEIEQTLGALRDGRGTIPAPFDRIALERE